MINFLYQNNNAGNAMNVNRHLTTKIIKRELFIMATNPIPFTPEKINIILKKCTKCGEEKPLDCFYPKKNGKYGRSSFCKECESTRGKEKYINSKEKISKYGKNHYEENKEKISECHKNNYIKNKEKIRKRHKKYNTENRELISKAGKKYYEKNKDRKKETHKQHYEKNKEKILKRHKKYRQTDSGKSVVAKSSHKHRALKQNATIEDFNPFEIFERDKYICQSCGCKTRPDYKNYYHPRYPNLDHIIPLSKGGEHSRRNTQCLCRQCNIEKSNNQKNDQLLLFGC